MDRIESKLDEGRDGSVEWLRCFGYGDTRR